MSRTLLAGGRALLFASTVGVVIVLLYQTGILAQDRQVGGIGLTVFADANFRGASATFRDDVPDLRAVRLNDQITSVLVGRGEVWEVCEDVNYGGRCQVLSDEESDLRRVGWSDTISSARQVRGGRGGRGGGLFPNFPNVGGRGRIELFAGTRFNGPSRAFNEAEPNLLPLGFNDQAMSVRLAPNETWELCADANFRNCRVINSSSADLSDIGMSTRISSLRPLNQGGRGRGDVGNGRPPFGGRARLVLYDQRNFRGQAFSVDDATPNFRGFNGRAESVEVQGGAWEICTDPGFRGRCTTVSDDVNDLGRIGLRNNVGSARPVRGGFPR